jgi:hypothetical protein
MNTKTKNMKTRSSQMKQVKSIEGLEGSSISQLSKPVSCHYNECPKGPDFKVMTGDQFPIDSATFTKIDNFKYKIEYNFNSNLNDSFKITGPFSPSSISNINNYELRKAVVYNPRFNRCECNYDFSLRNKNLSENNGFITSSEYALMTSNNGVISTISQINLPTSFIVYNQQGLYHYLNVDQNGNATPSSTTQ